MFNIHMDVLKYNISNNIIKPKVPLNNVFSESQYCNLSRNNYAMNILRLFLTAFVHKEALLDQNLRKTSPAVTGR